MVVYKDEGMEVVPGIVIPWSWFDGILCGIIEKGEEGINIVVDSGIGKLESALQALVDNNTVQFDNVGKAKLGKAVTLAMVKIYMPGLLPNP